MYRVKSSSSNSSRVRELELKVVHLNLTQACHVSEAKWAGNGNIRRCCRLCYKTEKRVAVSGRRSWGGTANPIIL